MITQFRPSLRVPSAAAGLMLGLAAPGAAFAQSEGCAQVTMQSLAIPGLVIDGSKMQEAGDGLPKHCIVSGAMNDRTGADGKHYAIRFEMRLPVEWNGRFLDQANGGNDGVVKARLESFDLGLRQAVRARAWGADQAVEVERLLAGGEIGGQPILEPVKLVAGRRDFERNQLGVILADRFAAGPKNSKGEALYSDWPVDGGVGTGNWRMWKVESPIAPWDHYPIIATMGAASLEYIFTTPPTPVQGTNEALMKALLSFNFDVDAPKIFAKTDAYPDSAMDFMTPPGVDDPKLAAFRQAGRKMIIYHGQADGDYPLDIRTRKCYAFVS
jgi:hypothetical protein